MYLIMMGSVVFGMMYGMTYGNLQNIGQPYDSNGNACGRGAAEDFPVLFFNTWVPNPAAVTDTWCVAECPTVEGQDIKCYADKGRKCVDIDTYPSYKYLNRFCLASQDSDTLKTLFDNKPQSVLTTGATNLAGLKTNSKKLDAQIKDAINKLDDIDAVKIFLSKNNSGSEI